MPHVDQVRSTQKPALFEQDSTKQRRTGLRPLLSASQRILRKLAEIGNRHRGLSHSSSEAETQEPRTIERIPDAGDEPTTAQNDDYLRNAAAGLAELESKSGVLEQIRLHPQDEPETGGEAGDNDMKSPESKEPKTKASKGKKTEAEILELLGGAEELTWGKLVATKRWHPKAWEKAQAAGLVSDEMMVRKAAESSASRKKRGGGRPPSEPAAFPCPGCLHELPGREYQAHECHAIAFGNDEMGLQEAVLMETLACIKYGEPLGESGLPKLDAKELSEAVIRIHTSTTEATQKRIRNRLDGKSNEPELPTVIWEERLAPIEDEPIPG